MESPAGSSPATTLQLGAGYPLASRPAPYGSPLVAVASEPVVIEGAWFTVRESSRCAWPTPLRATTLKL